MTNEEKYRTFEEQTKAFDEMCNAHLCSEC